MLESARKFESYTLRIELCKDKLDVTDTYDRTKTVFDNFQRAVCLYQNKKFVGDRIFDPGTQKFGGYEWRTYKEAGELVQHVGCGLKYIFREYLPRKDAAALYRGQEPVGIYALNRSEWLLFELSAFHSRRYSMALYDTLGADSLEYIVNHAEIQAVFCSIDKVLRLLIMSKKLPQLKAIISIDSFDKRAANPQALPFTVNSTRVLEAWVADKGMEQFDFEQVVKIGRTNPADPNPLTEEDLCTIGYTGGTTGTPKDAMSTHRNCTAGPCSSSLATYSPGERVILSLLPLAHTYDRATEYRNMLLGGSAGILHIIEDTQVLQPAIFPAVSHLFIRIYDRIAVATIHAPGIRDVIAHRAVNDKLEALSRGEGFRHALRDRIVFHKVWAILGGRVEVMNTGSAPLDPQVMQFLRITFNHNFSEDYAQTENSSTAIISAIGDCRPGRVCIPMPDVENKLYGVPEMKYFATDKPCPRGEIMARNEIVFAGYFRDPEKTKEVLTEEGWLLTGDIGRFNEDGTISIIDHVKNIFKLS
ncbi:medium-chain fatty acid-CoA ligase faa2 [Linderina pennispora]|nr:medium-chain fatty acid-CoA ligase faa2 [Linderina pennispora]